MELKPHRTRRAGDARKAPAHRFILAACATALTLALTGCATAQEFDAWKQADQNAGATQEQEDPESYDDAVALPDGDYEPGYFGWSGGSGRLQGIGCPSVTVRAGRASATIVFESPNYAQVRACGETYENLTPSSGESTFEIPVAIDRNFTVSAQTTAMSQPHWVDYELFITLADAGLEADGVPHVPGHGYVTRMAPRHATGFEVYYYADGFKVVDIPGDAGGARYLVVPEGAQVPAGAEDGFTVVRQPLSQMYVCATAAMSLIDAVGGLDAVTLTGTDAVGWSIAAPVRALESGRMAYAGKYNAPDYEALITSHCDLALESTMILHNPEVAETLAQLGIPVLIERSSYEADPLGRAEWARLYGALLNRETAADDFFRQQEEAIRDIQAAEPTGKSVAFFAIGRDGSVTVRRPGDYLSRSVEVAGGGYAFAPLDAVGTSATVTISMEEFYRMAHDADYLVYNGTIEGELKNMGDLMEASESFADFKAVRSGEVWTCGSELYQSADKAAEVIRDFHMLMTGKGSAQMSFLKKVGT